MITAQARREERLVMPHVERAADIPPERACELMAGQLDALERDIAAARRRARRDWATGPEPSHAGLPPVQDGEFLHLACGAAIFVRPVRPDDAGRLTTTHQRLSALTRYRRFLAVTENLTMHQAAYLTRVDHVVHEALVAVDARTGACVGVARYLCDPADRGHARVAAVVVDAWQQRGVGTALLVRLSARARANGVTSLTGATAPGNEAARRLTRRAGLAVADERTAGQLQLTIDLGHAPAAPPPPDRPVSGAAYARPPRRAPRLNRAAGAPPP